MIRFALLIFFLALPARAASWYAATNGVAGNTGAIGSPWDLQTALNKTNSVVGGDTLWLRQGVYAHSPQEFIPPSPTSGGNEGVIFRCNLFGTSSNAHVSVRPYTNEHAIIDGGAWDTGVTNFHTTARPSLAIGITGGHTTFGNYVWFYDLEFASLSTTSRNSSSNDSLPTDIPRSSGPYVYADGVKFIDCTFHDSATGIETWSDAADMEVNGCVLWNNGWKGTPANHGHGVYAQTYNASNPGKVWKNNLFCNAGYDNSIQCYGSGTVETSHHRLVNNVFSGSSTHGRALVGVKENSACILDRTQDNQVTDNVGYGVDLVLGYHQDECAYKDVIATGNIFRAGELQLMSWHTASLTNNTIYDESFLSRASRPSAAQVLSLFTNGLAMPTWDLNRNLYVLQSSNLQSFNLQGQGGKTLTQWRSVTGFDAASSVATNFPATNWMRLTVHDYNPNKANLVINNWTNGTNQTVSFASVGWSPGDTITIRNGQNYYGDVTTTSLDASTNAAINMLAAAHTVAIPFGDSAALTATYFPDFAAFEVERTAGTPPPPPTYTTTVNSANPASGVVITNSPVDIGGLGNGTTTYLRTNAQDVVTSLTAPAIAGGNSNSFSSWTRNGVLYSTNRATTYTNVASSVFAAVYTTPTPPSTNYTITITSLNPNSGVTITNSPVDNGGLGNGATSFNRTNSANVVSTITAPATASGNSFSEWQLNGVTYSTSRATTFTNTGNATFRAIYTTPAPPTVWTLSVATSPNTGLSITVSPNDNGGLGTGTSNFTRTNNQDVVTTLTAPGTSGLLVFSRWKMNESTYSSSTTITKTNVANNLLIAVYTTATFDITVDASGAGSSVDVNVSPADNMGASTGATPFTRTYDTNSIVTFVAPSPAPNGNIWSEWLYNGSSYSTNQTISVTNTQTLALTPVYVARPPAAGNSVSSRVTRRRP